MWRVEVHILRCFGGVGDEGEDEYEDEGVE